MSMSYADRFQGKVVLLTGASAGIGKAMALRLGRAGARLGLIARRAEVLAEVKSQIGAAEPVILLPGDVAEESFCREAVQTLAREMGGIDLVINNAGITMRAMFEETDLSVFRRIMDVNYFGSLYIARFSLPHLERSRGGIVFISSITGKRGFPTRSGYAASKFAMHGLFESLRVEWAPKGIHVGIVAPGYTDTEIRTHALGPDGKPRGEQGPTKGDVMSAEDAAEAILKAAAKRRREVILTKGGKIMVWLNKRFPRLADKLAANATG